MGKFYLMSELDKAKASTTGKIMKLDSGKVKPTQKVKEEVAKNKVKAESGFQGGHEM